MKRLGLFVFLCLLNPAWAGGKAVNDLVGFYKTPFINRNFHGYEIANTLILMRYFPSSAYFELKLDFTNGHTCGLSGIATSRKNELVYKSMDIIGRCVLHIKFDKTFITFKDDKGACWISTCGEEGGYP